MRRLLDGFYTVCGAAAVALMVLAIGGLMIVQVLGREVGLLIPGADDIVSYATAGMAFLGLAHTFRQGEMIRVGILLDRLGPRSRRLFEIVSLGITVAMVGFIAWHSVWMVWETYEFAEMAPGLLKIPLWIPQTSMALGAIALFVALLDELVWVLQGRPPRYETIAAERRARGEFVGEV